MKGFITVLACAVGIYLVTFGGHYVSSDESHRIAWAKSLIDCHCNDISRTFPGERYSIYGIGLSLLHLPMIMLARWIKTTTGLSTEGPLNMLLYVFNAAIGVALVYLILAREHFSSRSAALGAIAIGVTSSWFPYSKVEYAESVVTTLLLGMFLLAGTHPWLAGLIGGFAITVRTDALILVALTGIVASPKKSWLPVALAAIPGIALTAASNYARTRSVFDSGYEIDFSGQMLAGLYGFLFSAGKSVFLFSPLMLLFPGAVLDLGKDPARRPLAVWALLLLGVQLLLYSKWWDWSGDDAWGPRFLIPATLGCLTAVAASNYLHSRWFAVLAAAGFLVQIPPVMLGPHSSLMAVHLRNPTKTDPYTSLRSPITLDDMRFDPEFSQIIATFDMMVFKISRGKFERASSFLSSFDPPLEPEDIPLDIVWFHLRRKEVVVTGQRDESDSRALFRAQPGLPMRVNPCKDRDSSISLGEPLAQAGRACDF
jgi:hypothetical protein